MWVVCDGRHQCENSTPKWMSSTIWSVACPKASYGSISQAYGARAREMGLTTVS